MTPASGTGTPVSGTTDATLASLRARARTQLENAYGFPDPLPVATSSETLATLRDRVETMLQDTGNSRWATSDVDEAIEKALEEYNRHSPILKIDTVTLGSDGREVDISSLTDLVRVVKVWHPYDSTAPAWPPNWVQFDVYPGSILFIDEPDEPQTGEKTRIWYTAAAELNGLGGAAATTVPLDDLTYLINGAAYYAAQQRAIELAEELTVDDDVVKRLMSWTEDQGKAFRYGIRQQEPAWQRYAYAFRNDDIDEAVSWALGHFNEIAPQEAITSLTLASAGREISLTTITDLLRVTRVWWPYDSSDPAYEPNWVKYEVWGTGSSGTLFIDSASEPQSGDVVRIWYNRLATLNGLDGAATTTIPADAETLILTGAVGYVAQERIMEEPRTRWRVPRGLREWAEARLAEFTTGLAAYAKRNAAAQAGLHRIPAMDRWERQDDNQW